jgi:hypothetical protein
MGLQIEDALQPCQKEFSEFRGNARSLPRGDPKP